MKKEFWKWHRLKEQLNDRKRRVFFYEREIWFCSIGLNVGSEQDGKNAWFERPVLIFKKCNPDLFWGIPLTTKSKTGNWYFQFKIFYENSIPTENSAILHQIRIFDTKRLRRKMGVLNEKEFEVLVTQFQQLLPTRKLGIQSSLDTYGFPLASEVPDNRG